MLKRTRVFVIWFFILSAAIFGGRRAYVMIHADRSYPVINVPSESITVSVKGGDAAILEGVTASDASDGDLTDQLFIESRSMFNDDMKFTATIAVSDSANHITKVTREVEYSDYTPPQFELSEPLSFPKSGGGQDDVNIVAYLSAHDVLDGNISNKIRISGDYKISVYNVGEYPMEFIVTNSMGDVSSLPVKIKLYNPLDENSLPQIKLRNYLVNVPKGTEIDLDDMIENITYRGYVYYKNEDGNFYSGEYTTGGEAIMIPADFLSRSGKVDYNTPGVYEITYKYTDSAIDISNFSRLYVVVY